MSRTVFMLTWTVCIAVAGAEWTPVDVCSQAAKQSVPDIDGNLAVWQDERNGNKDIYGRRLPDGAEIAICTLYSNQLNPAVSGEVAVWQDNRSDSLGDIYAYDLDTEQELSICVRAGEQQFPDISGAIVVWQDKRNGNFDIYGYRLDTQEEFAVCTHPSNQFVPAVYGTWVVWQDDRNGGYDIYGLDLANPSGGEVELCMDAGVQAFPAIFDGLAVWQDNRNGSYDIYGRVSGGANTFEVAQAAGSQSVPAVFGDWIVWRDERNGSSNADIYAYRRSTGLIESVCAATGNQGNPAVSSRYIVWQDDSGSGDIRGAALPLNTTVKVLVPNGGEQALAGSTQAILWQTDGDPVDTVAIAYSPDGGDHWLTLTETPNTGSLACEIPDVDSQACLVRVSVSATIYDDSDAVFTIFACDPALTADVTGDCRVDLADLAVLTEQWLMCGNPYDASWCNE